MVQITVVAKWSKRRAVLGLAIHGRLRSAWAHCSPTRRPCLVSGATPAKQRQVLRSFNPPTTKKANSALLVVELDHPPSPKGALVGQVT